MNIIASFEKWALLGFLLDCCLAQYTPIPRWGQATVLVNDGLFIHGGNIDPSNSYTYPSAPPTNDLLYLSLASSFNPSTPPWQLVSSSTNASSSQGPALSWHTLSSFMPNQVLLFGGKFGANSPTVLPGAADSAFILGIDNPTEPLWTTEAPSWANEPIRRMRHSASSSGGRVFLIGGEKVDGSNLGFSTNYVFDTTGPSFNALPSDNGPPDISGHVSVILPNGRLLVLGGYSPSQNALLPLTTIWIMDTTQTQLQWSSVSVIGSQIPSPRRAFVAVALSNGNVVIHGGSDAIYQNTYDDGWALDTSQSPMTWTPVPALSQLGTRRDHFAIARGNMIIFGFGYGSSSAALSELQIYDSSSGQWASNYVPPPNSPTNTLSGPSRTQTGTASHTGTSLGASTSIASPGSTRHGDKSNGTAIAIATISVFGVITAGVALLYFRRKRINSMRGRFRMLTPRPGRRNSYDSSLFDGAVLIMSETRRKRSGMGWLSGLGILESGAAKRERLAQERRDILADEDTRHFSVGPFYGLDAGAGSSWSLRSVGAMIGGAMGLRTREPSTRSTHSGPWREKSDPFSDNAALMTDQDNSYTGAKSRPQGRRQQSYSSVQSARSYHDPFTDPIMEETREDYLNDNGREKITTRSTNVHSYPAQLSTLQTIAPQSADIHTLSTVTEQAESTHSPSQDVPLSPFGDHSPITSFTSLDDKAASSSNVVTSLPPAVSMRRSDSWWSRFSRTSFLDRKSSDSGRRYLDFRDPNPPPKLIAIAEALTPFDESPTSCELPGSAHSRQGSRVYGGGHTKSMSSLKTTRTTDTAAIERMGGMDVVQRASTPSHRSTGSTVGMESSIDSESVLEHSERPLLVLTDRGDEPLFASPVDGPLSPPKDLEEGVSPWRSTGAVAARVQAYEHKLSMEQDLAGLPPSPVNTRQREEKPRKRGFSVNYGLAPRPNLFIANPDTGHSQCPSSSS